MQKELVFLNALLNRCIQFRNLYDDSNYYPIIQFQNYANQFLSILESLKKKESHFEKIQPADYIQNSFLGHYTSNAVDELLNDIRNCINIIDALKEVDSNEIKIISLAENKGELKPLYDLSKVFIVHGTNSLIKTEVARLIENLGLEPIILHEQANGGSTIIEKFETHSAKAGFAIVLLTDDDKAQPKAGGKFKNRARQNVVFEMGYFFGSLGRKRVCTLYTPGVEIPSDIQGIAYVALDDSGAWKYTLVDELRDAGYSVSKDKIK